MDRRISALLGACSLLLVSAGALAEQKDERAGTCEDAKQQMDYFCNGAGNPNDMMMQFTACDNAKKNVAAACEGKVQADQEYKFDKK
jgi:hypothetical protein